MLNGLCLVRDFTSEINASAGLLVARYAFRANIFSEDCTFQPYRGKGSIIVHKVLGQNQELVTEVQVFSHSREKAVLEQVAAHLDMKAKSVDTNLTVRQKILRVYRVYRLTRKVKKLVE